jgi:hypothetical protein
MLDITNLSWADKAAGGFSGLVKLYVITLLVLVAGMIISPLTGDAWVRESRVLSVTAYTWPAVYPVLDGLGVLPDLAELQAEAKRYIIQQASGSIFGPANNFGAGAAASSADMASVDLANPLSLVISNDTADRRLSLDQSELPTGLAKNSMIDFFLGWGDGNTR